MCTLSEALGEGDGFGIKLSSRQRHSGITAIASKCNGGVLHEGDRFVSFGRFPMEESLVARADQPDYMAS